jgi:hypothetical protein
MSNYYFLKIFLPPLQLETKLEVDFEELKSLLKRNLNAQDYAATVVIRRYYDLENLRALWLGQEHDGYGNLGSLELEEAAMHLDKLPGYGNDFLEEHSDTSKRLQHFGELIARYYRHEIHAAKGFLKKYLQFEWLLRLVQTVLRAQYLHRDLKAEWPSGISDMPMQADFMEHEDVWNLPQLSGLEPLKSIHAAYGNRPLELHRALIDYRFHMIDTLVNHGPFAIDHILAYMIKLILAEKWQALDPAKGISTIEAYVKEQR